MSAKPDFAANLKELEAITEWFESDQVDLNEALTKFERGMELANTLKRELEQVENRVEKIKAKFDGSPVADAVPPASVEISDDNEPSLF